MNLYVVNVIVENRQSDLLFNEEGAAAIAQSVVELEERPADEVGIHFVDGEEIQRLHQQFFSDSSFTDCISIPLGDDVPYRLLGDVFVCPKAALLYVEENGGDPLWETTLYVVHGLLHLLGYDDGDDEVRGVMRAAEKRHMAVLESRGALLSR